MLKLALLFIFKIAAVSSLDWASTSYVLNHEQFFIDVMKETILELERREWCNLKLDNIYQTISDSLYNFLVNGTVIYSNGFLISIQKIDVANVQQIIMSWSSNGVTTANAAVRGRLNLNDAKVGFDVEATLFNNGERSVQRYTGIFNFVHIQFDIEISKNLNTGVVSFSSSLKNLPSGTGVKMIYMPANNVTEALSRRWVAGNNFDSVDRWGREDMANIVLNITNNVIPFPGICIGCYA